MALTALERLDLSDELDSLLEQAKTAKGLDLLDINDQVDDVLVKLGYGQAPGTPPPADPAPPKVEDTPQIVTDFLAGKFISQADDAFVTTLNTLDQYVGIFLTLDDVKAGAISWVNNKAAVAA